MLNKILIGILLSSSTVVALAGTVPVDLYRGGNSTSPRMDNVREQDIIWYLNDGQQWVVGKKVGYLQQANLLSLERIGGR